MKRRSFFGRVFGGLLVAVGVKAHPEPWEGMVPAGGGYEYGTWTNGMWITIQPTRELCRVTEVTSTSMTIERGR